MLRLLFTFALLQVLLLLFPNRCSSQSSYHPLPYSNATWREYEVGDIINFPDLFSINEYYLDGDSLIGNFVYQRVRFYSIAMSGDAVPSNSQFFYRQDTINKKVYIQNIFYPFNDTLIYNFDIQLGDTLSDMLFMPPSNSTDYFVRVDGIDSIETPIGFLRRFRLLSTIIPWGYGYWIEGIGNIKGFFGPPIYLPGDAYRQIICFKQNDTTIYDTPVDEADCDSVYLEIQEVDSRKGMYVYPNLLKAGEAATISFGWQSNGTLFISDLLNYPKAEFKATQKTVTYQFDKPGIYFLYYQSENSTLELSKIIVTP